MYNEHFISLKVSTITSVHLDISIQGHEILFKLICQLFYFKFIIVFILTFLIVSSAGRNQSQTSGREENKAISTHNFPGWPRFSGQ